METALSYQPAVQYLLTWLINLFAEFLQFVQFILHQLLGFFHSNCLKPYFVVCFPLNQFWNIHGNDSGNFGISSGGLAVRKQNDRFSVAWYLNGTKGNSIGNNIRCRFVGNKRPFQT